MKLLWLVLLLAHLLLACDSSLNSPPQLIPLRPYSYEFSNGDAKNRIDYFYIEPEQSDDAQLKLALYPLLLEKMPKNSKDYALYSIYVYKKTAQLNSLLMFKPEVLRTFYKKNDLISYSRWNKGQLTMFYLLENSNVVFDLLHNTVVSPAWEFD